MNSIPLPLLQCSHCSHRWVPRSTVKLRCPRCQKSLQERPIVYNEYRMDIVTGPAIKRIKRPFPQQTTEPNTLLEAVSHE